MSDIEKRIEEIHNDIKVIMSYIPKVDIVLNEDYCKLRQGKGKDGKLTIRALKDWFTKGCPREDARHVSIKAVDEWVRTHNTRQPKSI